MGNQSSSFMDKYRFILICLTVFCFLQSNRCSSAETQSQSNPTNTAKSTQKELKLEDLFPEKGLFGPSAQGQAFSYDGAFAAFLYHPYKERRHGMDLWIVDTSNGQTQRVTSVSVMSKNQANTRKVKEDRVKKAKEAKKPEEKKVAEKKAEEKQSESQKSDAQKSDSGDDKKVKKEDDKDNGDWVDDKDADAEKAPRYSGVSRFVWSPTASELLFISEGDVYRYFPKKNEIVRLTRTKDNESSVRYLPNGSGFTYLSSGALMRVLFGQSMVEQIDPKLPSGEEMVSYEISPNCKRLVFLTRKEMSAPPTERRVRIAQYRDRFMGVTEVPRQVSDDPIRTNQMTLYLHDFTQSANEDGKIYQIHRHQSTGPRDYLSPPDWAPDSSRITFAFFEQSSEHILIYESQFPKEAEPTKKTDGKSVQDKSKTEDNQKKDAEKKDEDKKDDQKKGEDKPASGGETKKEENIVVQPARVVYRILHHGGPNTPNMVDPWYLNDSRQILYLSEQSGYRQLHILDTLDESVTPLTQGRFEIYPLSVQPLNRKMFFLAATKEDSTRRDIFRVNLKDRTLTRISTWPGVYQNPAVSPDGTKVLANYVTYGKLNELVFINSASNQTRVLTDSHPAKAKEVTQPKPTYFTFKNRHGHEIKGSMFKPSDAKPDQKLPLLVYVYGGPLGERKMVHDGNYSPDPYFFAYYMAQKHGYLTVTIDPRGSSGYGGFFEKSNYENVGKPQVEDLVDGVKWLIANHNVDSKRVAIHGWSFGGFQTQMCLYTEPDVFAVGIAGAGPTEWENYNSWYSTGTIGRSRTGQTDLQKFSLLPLAKNLKAKLLLVHGMEDDNVLYQDTVRVYRELLKAGKETNVELFLDPTGKHGLDGDVKRLGRYRKYEDFLLRYIGRGPVPEPAKTDKESKVEKKDNSEKKEDAQKKDTKN